MEWPAKRFEKPSAAVFGTKEVSSITTPISSCRAEHPAAGNLGRCSLHERRDHVAQAKIRAALRDTPRLRKRRLGPDRQRSYTFNPLFPNPMYSSLSALLGPSNLTDVGPTIRLALDSKTTISPEIPFYWRSSIHDGIYNFAGVQIRPGSLSTARFVGYQPGLVIYYSFSPDLSAI